jgi:hypothetical protein
MKTEATEVWTKEKFEQSTYDLMEEIAAKFGDTNAEVALSAMVSIVSILISYTSDSKKDAVDRLKDITAFLEGHIEKLFPVSSTLLN